MGTIEVMNSTIGHPDFGIKPAHVTGVARGPTGGAKAHNKPLSGDFDILKIVVSRPGVRTPSTAVVITSWLPPSQISGHARTLGK